MHKQDDIRKNDIDGTSVGASKITTDTRIFNEQITQKTGELKTLQSAMREYGDLAQMISAWNLDELYNSTGDLNGLGGFVYSARAQDPLDSVAMQLLTMTVPVKRFDDALAHLRSGQIEKKEQIAKKANEYRDAGVLEGKSH